MWNFHLRSCTLINGNLCVLCCSEGFVPMDQNQRQVFDMHSTKVNMFIGKMVLGK